MGGYVRRLVEVAPVASCEETSPLLHMRFWTKVSAGGEHQCWEWQGVRGRRGYGYTLLRGKRIGSHRMAWLLIHGPIPDGLFVCHKCDNRICVNPSHLFLGDNAANSRDRHEKGRSSSRAGVNNPHAKLTEADVRTIRGLRGLKTQDEIASRFGVARTSISNIFVGQTWGGLV